MDGSFGQGVDELLALAVLHAAAHVEDSAVALAAVNVTYPSLDAARFVDALGWVYAEHASRNFPERFRRGWSRLPVGLLDTGAAGTPPAAFAAALERADADGEPLYRTDIKELNDTGISAALIRNALTAHHEQNALILLTGPATALLQMLGLNQTLELVSSKVKTLVLGGAFQSDLPAAQELLAEWPTPVVALDPAAAAVRYPLETLAKGFSWTPNHPLVDAWKATGAAAPESTPATLAAFYSVRPTAPFWKLSEPGRLRLLDDGSVQLEADPNGKHRLVAIADGQRDALLAELTGLVQAEPAERRMPGFLKRLIEREKEKELEEQKQAAQPSDGKKPE